jgi:hypothetical protein
MDIEKIAKAIEADPGRHVVTIAVSTRAEVSKRFVRAMNGESQGAWGSFESEPAARKALGQTWPRRRQSNAPGNSSRKAAGMNTSKAPPSIAATDAAEQLPDRLPALDKAEVIRLSVAGQQRLAGTVTVQPPPSTFPDISMKFRLAQNQYRSSSIARRSQRWWQSAHQQPARRPSPDSATCPTGMADAESRTKSPDHRTPG